MAAHRLVPERHPAGYALAVDVVAKLQLKPGQELECLHRPSSVELGVEPHASGGAEPALLAFVVDRAALEACRKRVVASASKDRLTWVAYPKAGQLGTDLNRDSLASFVTANGVRPVRQIAIDETWSALRLRPAE